MIQKKSAEIGYRPLIGMALEAYSRTTENDKEDMEGYIRVLMGSREKQVGK
jgi:hypothetical protein